MFQTKKRAWIVMLFAFLATGLLGLGLMPLAFGARQPDIKKVQETLRDRGFYTGRVDGVMGSHTREGIREYQKAENLPVTGRLDAQTAAKLGVEEESVGGTFKGAGQEVGRGGQEVGHEMKKGKPVAAGKEMGKAVGRAGKKVGSGVKKAVTPDSDREKREKKKAE